MTSTGQMDLDICQCPDLVDKVRNNDVYAQNLYAAMCNQEWQYQDVWTVLTDKTWSCSWRSAGGIVADIRGEGDYMDWYCSGMIKSHPDDDICGAEIVNHYVPEGTVTEEIRWDLAQIGWHPVNELTSY
jgi:hypothetical protein